MPVWIYGIALCCVWQVWMRCVLTPATAHSSRTRRYIILCVFNMHSFICFYEARMWSFGCPVYFDVLVYWYRVVGYVSCCTGMHLSNGTLSVNPQYFICKHKPVVMVWVALFVKLLVTLVVVQAARSAQCSVGLNVARLCGLKHCYCTRLVFVAVLTDSERFVL